MGETHKEQSSYPCPKCNRPMTDELGWVYCEHCDDKFLGAKPNGQKLADDGIVHLSGKAYNEMQAEIARLKGQLEQIKADLLDAVEMFGVVG